MARLRSLRVRNLVILEDVAVEFGDGLNLLTGETGAGKSVLVDALDLASGARADRSMVRAGADAATVEVLFDVAGDAAVRDWAADHGMPPLEDGELLVRREIAASGTGRVHVNGAPCTVSMLRELAELLLELHRQHQQRSLLAAESHQDLLDRFGGHGDAVARVQRAFRGVADSRALLERLGEAAARRDERAEGLRRTVREIDAIAPRAGELVELEAERRILANAERMAGWLEEVVAACYEGEHAAATRAATAARRAEDLAALDPSLAELAGRLRAAALELQDAGGAFRDYRERRDFDPARLDRVEERRAALQRLCLAHGVDEAGLVERAERARAELAALDSIDEGLAAAGAALTAAEDEYLTAGAVLTRKRQAAARRLEGAVGEQLSALAMARARLEVGLEEPQGSATIERPGSAPRVLSAGGAERVEFLLSANPGEPPRPLGQVASGGELSRVMLALHAVNEQDGPERVLVFDEIDAGVSGAVADAVGARLERLARRGQVLCVTHLPQIAAYADRHYSVRKRVESGRTRAGIASLSAEERVEELARMLGGRKATAASRRHASELLSAAGRRPRPQPRGSA
jgi:DNA repair protein RecN (Recombination protein N)